MMSAEDRFAASRCGVILRRLTEKLETGHLLNAIYESTELQQAMLKEFGEIRHGRQKDVSWLNPTGE